MQTDILNRKADTALKTEQVRWEPWKALSAAFGAGIAVASALPLAWQVVSGWYQDRWEIVMALAAIIAAAAVMLGTMHSNVAEFKQTV